MNLIRRFAKWSPNLAVCSVPCTVSWESLIPALWNFVVSLILMYRRLEWYTKDERHCQQSLRDESGIGACGALKQDQDKNCNGMIVALMHL